MMEIKAVKQLRDIFSPYVDATKIGCHTWPSLVLDLIDGQRTQPLQLQLKQQV